jgi:LysR family transcriptional regulator, regulator for bpeEF and oprC
VARKLGDLHFGLYAGPAYIAARGMPRRPADLARHDLVVFTGEGARSHWTLYQARRREQLALAGPARLRVNAGAAVRSAVLVGLGIGQLPEAMADELLRAGRLQRVLPRWQPQPVPVFAVYPSNRYLTPKVRAFVDLAIQRFPQAG